MRMNFSIALPVRQSLYLNVVIISYSTNFDLCYNSELLKW
jgi:hypothetical protein